MKLLERLVETLDRCSLDIADEEYIDRNRLSVSMKCAETKVLQPSKQLMSPST